MSTDSSVMDFEATDTPEELRKAKFEPIPKGTMCHVIVAEASDIFNDQTQQVTGFELILEVREADVSGQTGKRFREQFFEPLESHKDKGEFCTKRRKALALASGLVPPNPVGRVQTPWGQLLDLQFVTQVKLEPWRDDPTKFSNHIDGCKMFHVDDPAVAHVPKNQTLLAANAGHTWPLEMIQAAARKLAEKTAETGAKNGKVNGSPAPAAAAPKIDYSQI